MRKLEVLHKEVGGYLTRSARIAASIAQIDNHYSLKMGDFVHVWCIIFSRLLKEIVQIRNGRLPLYCENHLDLIFLIHS